MRYTVSFLRLVAILLIQLIVRVLLVFASAVVDVLLWVAVVLSFYGRAQVDVLHLDLYMDVADCGDASLQGLAKETTSTSKREFPELSADRRRVFGLAEVRSTMILPGGHLTFPA